MPVDAPLDRNGPQRPLHVGVHHRQHALGRDARPLQRGVCRRAVERQAAERRRGGVAPAARLASVTVGWAPPRP